MPRQVTRRFRGTTVIDNLRLKNVTGGPFDEIGRVYHINTAGAVYPGNDANVGLEYEHPLLTITEALSRCVTGRNDYILIHDYWRPTGETWPIVHNKNKVHICGVAQRGLPYPAIHPATDVAAFQLSSSGQYGSIEYLTIGGGNSHGGIDWANSGQIDGFHIVGCLFGHQWFGTPYAGILQPLASSRGGYGNVVEGCTFIGNVFGKGALSAYGIAQLTVGQPFWELQVIDCSFLGVPIGVYLASGYGGEIRDNRFTVEDAANGEAITLVGTSIAVMVTENRAMNGMLNAGYTYNPYRDLAANTVNHWGMNYRGNAVIEPVGV